jgi:hypothetical protein
MNEASRQVQQEPETRAKVGSVVADTPRSAKNSEREASDGRQTTRGAGQERALGRPRPQASKSEHTGLQRTAAAIRTVLPLVQKMLPLLDGNIASVAANLLAPRFQAPPVDLHPVEVGLARLHGEIAVLHDKNAEHDATLKRIGQQLEGMKDALESAASEQQETMLQVSKIRRTVLLFSLLGLTLLAAAVTANVYLLFHMGQTAH